MNPVSQEWLRNDSGLDPLVAEALLAEETRPRAFPFRDGVVVILRGVNLNKGFSPEDMVSVRVWTNIMYLLTILSGVFLPLMFLTGLLGINVGGIPGSQHPWGFAIVCGILAGIVLAQVMMFRRLKRI